MHINNETNDVRAGQIVLIPAGAIQFLENTGNCDLCFLCIVAPPWQECDEELVAV
jgi:mannose-6-phosphate isomerase-like protein (cupin superfamily)